MQHPVRVQKKFGERVRSLRSKKGWSQERLALESGLGRGFMGSIERGEKAPGMLTLCKLARVFEMSLSRLVEGIDE